MTGALSRKARADAEAAAKAEDQARLDAEARAKAQADAQKKADADKKAAEDEEDKKKKAEADKAEADKKAAEGKDCPNKDDEEMDKAAADPGTVAQLCVDAGVGHKAKAMIDAKLTLAEVKRRLQVAADIQQMCRHAQRVNPAIDAKAMAEDFDRGNATADHAGKVLLEKLASMQSPEIASRHGAPGAGSGNAAAPAADHGWGDIIAREANRHKPAAATKH